MSVFADCQDERNKKTIQEIDCPECMEEDGLEVFLKDGDRKSTRLNSSH